MTTKLTVSRNLANELRKITTSKKDKMAKIAQLLGPTRVLRAWWDANPAAKHPALTGTEWLNISYNGAMSLTGGDLTGFGLGTVANKFNSVDLTTGACVFRIEGNGYYVQGSGSVGGDTVFILDENPTSLHGLAFAASASLEAFRYTPSGIGTAAPVKQGTSPHQIKAYSYADPRDPRAVATITFDTRIEDFTLEDPDMARNHGDASVYRTQDAKWGNFLFGANMFISDKNNTEDGVNNLEQVALTFAYNSEAFNTYPADNTYHRDSMVFNLPPCKFFMTDEYGTILNIFEMPDHMPINDRRLNSGNWHRGGRTDTAALNPQFNCWQALPWQNSRPRQTDIIKKIYPGLKNYRPTMSKIQSSMISVEPLITGGYGGFSANGLADFWYADKYPLPYQPKQLSDPFLDNHMNAAGSSAMYMGWAEGIAYIIGGFGCHNMYTSPGGPRSDRCAIPSVLALYLTTPDAVMYESGMTYTEQAHAWYLNSFNHSVHCMKSPSNLDGLPYEDVMNDVWGCDNTYYGSYPRDLAVALSGDQRDGTGPANYDMDGNMYISGHAHDPLHNYHHRGWGSITWRSPMHAVFSKFDSMMGLALHQEPFGNPRDDYMKRTMAWKWLQVTMGWKNGSKHRYGVPQAAYENHFGRCLDAIDKYLYTPIFEQNEDSPYARGLRQLGLGLDWNGSNFAENKGWLGFYNGHVLQIMKQTGLWHRMRAINPRYGVILDNVIRNMDTRAFGQLAICNGRPASAENGYFFCGDGQNLDSIPTSWADWKDKTKNNDDADMDLLYKTYRNSSGVLIHRQYDPDQDVSIHQMLQYVRLRPNYFPELTHPLMAQANSVVDGFDADILAHVNSTSDNRAKLDMDGKWRYPGIAAFNGPLNPGDLRTSY